MWSLPWKMEGVSENGLKRLKGEKHPAMYSRLPLREILEINMTDVK